MNTLKITLLAAALVLTVTAELPAVGIDLATEQVALDELQSLMGTGSAECAGVIIGVSLAMLLLGAATGGAAWVVAGAFTPLLVVLC